MIASLWAVIQTEVRQTWRPIFWAVQGLWLLPLATIGVPYLGRAFPPSAADFVSEQLVFSLMLWLVLLPLIAGPALTRDLGAVGDLLWATPLDALTHLLGVSAGLLLALVPAMGLHLGAQWLVGSLLVGPSAALAVLVGLPLLLSSTVAALGMISVLALLLRRVVPLLLLWVALWAALLQVSQGLGGEIRAVGLASPVNLFFHSIQLSRSVGLGPSRALVQGLLIWFLGLGTFLSLMALAVALLTDGRRAVRRGGTLLTWVVAAALLCTGGWVLHARAAHAQAIPLSPFNIQAGVWQVEAHTLEVTVDAARDHLDGRSALRLAAQGRIEGSEVVLRLNPGMRPTTVEDGKGQTLAWEQVGDSLVVVLPAPPTTPLTLRLGWHGSPQVAYRDYGLHVSYRYPAFDTPQVVRALLTGGVGYLFRDSDWYPWPWGEASYPQQAAESDVTIRVSGAQVLAPASPPGDVLVWEGDLPEVLLVLPPPGSRSVGGRTLHVGSPGDAESALVWRLEQMVALVPQVAEVLGAEGPTHIVALPYLDSVVWCGDLLLVPEGSGTQRDMLGVLLLRASDAQDARAALEARAVIASLTHAWLSAHAPVPTGWVRVEWDRPGAVAVTGPAVQEGLVTASDTEAMGEGRWIASVGVPSAFLPEAEIDGAAEAPGVQPMPVTQLSPTLELEVFALWLALELAEPSVREGDLAVLLSEPDPNAEASRAQLFLHRFLPLTFPAGQAQKAALLEALHSWMSEVGREQGLRVVGQVIGEWEGPFDLARLLAVLSQGSGVRVQYEESE